jgi:hypothetical protein
MEAILTGGDSCQATVADFVHLDSFAPFAHRAPISNLTGGSRSGASPCRLDFFTGESS